MDPSNVAARNALIRVQFWRGKAYLFFEVRKDP